jgi:CTP:molybdopterin cytidylyltransferase MocA
MKLVILAGGLGTRFSEETVIKPKPMVEIGGKPIIWHIMRLCCLAPTSCVLPFNYLVKTTISMGLSNKATLDSDVFII